MNRPSKTRLFEEYQVATEGGDVLHAKIMRPKPPMRPQRVIFMAPLIGAGASTSLLTFRTMTRRGSILFSFEYGGHARSTGTFTLDRTIRDVRDALMWASKYASEQGLPLHGFATCYGTVPLLAQFVGEGRSVPLKSLSAVSGLFRLDHILRFESFAPILSQHLGREISAAEALAGFADGSLDTNGPLVRQALHEFMGGMFPELRVGYDHFEELSYDRADLAATFVQFCQARYLEGLAVPSWLPCEFFFGRQDELMSLHLPEGREAYRKHIQSLIPQAGVCDLELDHFGRGPDHDLVIERVGDVAERYDNAPIPAPHIRQVVRDRSIRV